MATRVDELSLPKLDFFLGTNREDRRKVLRDTAKNSWLAKTDIGYTVLTYDTIMGVLRDKRWHSATGLGAQLQGITDEAFLGRRQVSILNAEGDVHVRLRRLVAPAFSPRSADRLRPFMRETVNSLLDPFAASGKAEVVGDICEPYPIPIICELLGAPKEDWKLFSRLASEILLIFSDNLAQNMPVFLNAQQELEKYTEGLIEKRRSVPADDLITDLIAAEEAGDKLNTEELTMMVDAVIVGGTDTTRNQLGLALALFAEYPEQWALLGKDPSLAQRAVEEVLRWATPVLHFRRTTQVATQLAGTDITGHNDDRILEVDFTTEAICHLTVVEALQHEVEYIRVCLFYFIEQHNRVGAATHFLGKLSSFFISDVSGRRSNQT